MKKTALLFALTALLLAGCSTSQNNTGLKKDMIRGMELSAPLYFYTSSNGIIING